MDKKKENTIVKCVLKVGIYINTVYTYLGILSKHLDKKCLLMMKKTEVACYIIFFSQPQEEIFRESTWRKRKRSLVDLQLRHG